MSATVVPLRTPASRRRALEVPAAARGVNDALVGIAWFNGLSHSERAYWLEVAESATPADAWRAFQSGVPGP
jgi:hypothetical protein